MSQYTRELGRAAGLTAREARAMQQSLARIAKAVTAVGLAAAVGLGALIRQQINVADQMGKMAQRTGVATESLSTLAFAASQSGTSIESLETSLVRLSRNMQDTANGTGDARQAFRLLGIEVQDSNGNLRKSEDVLLDVAQEFSQLADGAEKTALATRLFGRAGAELIPLLNQGAGGIGELQARARELGLEISSNTAVQAALFNDRLKELQSAGTGLGREMMTELMPSLLNITSAMIQAQKESGIWMALLVGVGGVLSELFTPSDERRLQRLNTELQNVQANLARGLAGGASEDSQFVRNQTREIERLTKAIGELTDKQERAATADERRLKEMGERASKLAEEQEERLRGTMARLRAENEREAAAARADAAEKARLDSITSMIQALEVEGDTLGMTSREIELHTLRNLGATETQLEYATALAKTNDERIRAAELARQEKADNEARQNSIKSLIEGLEFQAATLRKTSREIAIYRLSLMGAAGDDLIAATARINAAYDLIEAHERLMESQREAERNAKTTGERMVDYAQQAANNIQDAFAKFLFDPFKDGLKGMLRGFIDVIRQMIAQAAAARILGNTEGFFGAILGGLGLGGRAVGGPVSAGNAFIVGERGPEIFVPHTAGRIQPGMSGGGVTVVQNNTFQAGFDPAQAMPMLVEAERAIYRGVEQRLNFGYFPA
jgi:hypothetical protein